MKVKRKKGQAADDEQGGVATETQPNTELNGVAPEQPCPTCHGQGGGAGNSGPDPEAPWTCPHCEGSGQVPADILDSPAVNRMREIMDADKQPAADLAAARAELDRQQRRNEELKRLRKFWRAYQRKKCRLWLIANCGHLATGRPQKGQESLPELEDWLAGRRDRAGIDLMTRLGCKAGDAVKILKERART